jgi:membrane protease YdiL (CAAX protease family)
MENKMEIKSNVSSIPQYSLGKILLIWAAAALPMGLLGWVVAPALAPDPAQPGFERVAALTVGLVWQFVLVVLLLYRETGTLHWSTFRPRLWLNPPRSPKTGEPRGRLWWWLLPVVLATALYEMQVRATVNKEWAALFPFLAEPPGFSLGAALATPAARSQLAGAWGVYTLFLGNALFNTFLGEELLFRGLLLPRMAGVFGRWDWVMNGLLFGLYHLHQPWSLLSSAITGILLYALPSRYFCSAWFGIIAHSGQSIFLAILLLGLVLGLA